MKKELKEARFKIKKLEDNVEHLTLSKSRVECEVNKLRVESDSLANLLSLRQTIYNHVPPSKSIPKKKKKQMFLFWWLGKVTDFASFPMKTSQSGNTLFSWLIIYEIYIEKQTKN